MGQLQSSQCFFQYKWILIILFFTIFLFFEISFFGGGEEGWGEWVARSTRVCKCATIFMLKSLRSTQSWTSQALTGPPDPTYVTLWPWKISQFFSTTRLMFLYWLCFAYNLIRNNESYWAFATCKLTYLLQVLENCNSENKAMVWVLHCLFREMDCYDFFYQIPEISMRKWHSVVSSRVNFITCGEDVSLVLSSNP